jgi:hypothetical protein
VKRSLYESFYAGFTKSIFSTFISYGLSDEKVFKETFFSFGESYFLVFTTLGVEVVLLLSAWRSNLKFDL